jgi:hypothetical protein
MSKAGRETSELLEEHLGKIRRLLPTISAEYH